MGAPRLKDLTDDEINLFLPNFFSQLRKPDGEPYALNSTRAALYALQRIFQDSLKRTNVLFKATGPFSPVWNVVNSRLIQDAAERMYFN